ncbi:hypothetical protein T484DRAFT_1756109 [Baffinella frigidus]|nr:hypothetical protein T484DRAFT_1756109 [Cryptophyta sp. CCMP2293]
MDCVAERPMVLAGLDHQGILAGLARRSAPQRVPATFAASLRQTLSVLDDVMRPSGITPVSDTPSPFGPLIIAPFDRQWHFRRCDARLATSDHLEVRVFRDEEWVKLAVVITHTAFDFGPLGKTTTSIGFDKTLSYKEYTQVRGSVFFNEAELTQVVDRDAELRRRVTWDGYRALLENVKDEEVVPSIFKTSTALVKTPTALVKTPTALVKTPTALVKVDYSIKTSAGLDTVVIKNAMDMMGSMSILAAVGVLCVGTAEREKREKWSTLLDTRPVYHRMVQSTGVDMDVCFNTPWAPSMDMDMLTESLALAHIKRPLGVTFSLSSELIPYQTKIKTVLLKAKHPTTKLSKANLPKNKRPRSLRWRASPSLVPPFLEI